MIGALSGWLATSTRDAAVLNSIRGFAVVGFCGGFTTFSTFSNETFRMLENGQWGMAGLYAFGSLAAGFAAVALGFMHFR